MPDLFEKGSKCNKRDHGLDTYFIFIIIIVAGTIIYSLI